MTMASTTRPPPPPSLPPKVPLTSSLSDQLAKTSTTRPPHPLRAPSTGSNMSAVSDSSREGLRREIVRRRKSLTESEFNFLQGVVANGTEVEVTLVQQKLNDPSLGFDVDEGDGDGEADNQSHEGDTSRRSSLGSVHTPTQQESLAFAPPPPLNMMGQLLCPTLSMEENTLGSFDPEASIDTCATGRGKPPAMPMPLSPRRDLANFRVPSHAELYPDAHVHSRDHYHDQFQYHPSSTSDLEQTPLVQNLRPPPKSLEGAAHLPIPGDLPEDFNNLMTPGTNNTSTGRPLSLQWQQDHQLHRRSSNPLLDQLWRAHEQGLVVTPQQSTKRLQIRREHSLSALSPNMLRRYSSSASGAWTGSGSAHYYNNYRHSKSMDHHARSLLNPQELRLIKQRHFRTQSQIISTAELLSSSTLQQQQQQQQTDHQSHHRPHQMQSLDAMTMMMVLQNTSTDSTENNSHSGGAANDITSLLLPTDEEIFRRSLQAKRPPPPRPFGGGGGGGGGGTSSSHGLPKPPPPSSSNTATSSNSGTTTIMLNRMASDGATPTIQRRPSALRRMTSDGSQRSKSVSFQIQDRNKAAQIASIVGDGMDDSLSTYASEHHHPASEILRDTAAATAAVAVGSNSSSWGRRDSDCSLNLHKAHPIRQESIGSTASGWEAAYAFQQGLSSLDCDIQANNNHLNRKDSINSVASLNLHRAHPIRQESIGSTIEGAKANRTFQEEVALAAAMASSPLQLHPRPGQDQQDESALLPHRDSVASLNLHKAHPIRQDSIGSVTGGDSALEAFRRQFSVGKGWGHRESLNSLASLDLHIANPIIQDSIFQRQDSLDSSTVVEGGEGTDTIDAFRPGGWTRKESMSNVASMDLHRAQPLNGWTTRRESTNTLSSSLRLELAHPIRKDSIASAAEGYSAVEAFREEVAAQSWNRRDSTGSIASLNLHKAHPIRKDSIASVAEDYSAAEAFREEVAAQSWNRRDSTGSIASLNLHKARPVRQESICSNAAGFDATESLRREFLVEPNTVLKPTWGRQSSMGSVASLNLHKAHPVVSETASASAAAATSIDVLRNQGSAFVSDSEVFEMSLNSIPPAAKEALKKEVESGSRGSLRAATDLAALQRDSLSNSLTSIPSLHPGRPIRQESIASTAAGLEAKELLRQQVSQASIVASEWEGVVLPDEWEDKKVEDEDVNDEHLVVKVSARDMPRPVMMRLASNNECDEEGMEVAAVDELVRDFGLDQENSPQLKLKTQILVPEQPEGAPRRESGSVPSKEEQARMPEREPAAETKRRQENYRHFPNSLISFGADSSARSSGAFEGRSCPHTVEVSASFDESKSIDRYRGVFRGGLPLSISEDELSALLISHRKPKPLSRGQSDATVFPSRSASWELDTVVGEYDGWAAMRDDYINGYGGGGTLPFQILGTSARDVDSQPHVLSPPLMESLQSFFPIAKSQDNFWMKYSMVRDGASLHTLMQRARGTRHSILALETIDGEVFGAFVTEPWRKTWNYFGSGESFLWRMRNSRKTKCFSIIDQAAMESEIDVFPYTGANQNIQLCTHTMIAVGGGNPEHTAAEEKRDDSDNNHSSDLDKPTEIKDHEWGYGLALQADLQHGSSSPCLTFGSPSLSNVHSDGSVFEICNVELWGLTPCNNLMDAEKLELGRLFLEPSFNNNTYD